MSSHITVNPVELYHLKTIPFDDITDTMIANEDIIVNLFWIPNPMLINALRIKLDRMNVNDMILDVGCGQVSFPNATHFVDIYEQSTPDRQIICVDLDYDKFLFADKSFHYVYCRHTLEDIMNPRHAFLEITRIGEQGYIETPSPMIEIMKGVHDPEKITLFRGYSHHRYIVWSDIQTNTLHFLPKFPIIEYLNIPAQLLKRLTYLANHYPVYWNNYYVWDTNRPPNVVIYRHGVNFDLMRGEYEKLITNAIFASMEYTNMFIEGLGNGL